MLTIAEENYLKAIYKILERNGESNASTKLISKELGTSSASVTDMIQKLNEKSLLHYEKYYGVSLTKEGHKIAIELIRKHRLWETFLYTHLNFTWDQVHEVAEQLEHVQSNELIVKLDEFLGYPKFDPHGDPIPNKNGNFTFRAQSTLAQIVDLNTELYVLGVRSHEKPFLQFLDSKSIHPGKRLKIISYNEFDQTHMIENELQELISMSYNLSKEILVRPI